MTEPNRIKDAIHPVAKFLDQIRIDTYEQGRPFQKIQLKRDGYCLTVFKHNGELHAYTRTPTRVWSNQEWYHRLRESLPERFWLVGELFVSGGTATDVRSVLCSQPQKEGQFEAFYSPHCKDFEEFNDKCIRIGVAPIAYSNTLSTVPVNGYEGYVLKNRYHPSGPYAWMKFKPEHTLDLRIVGFEKSFEGKHARKLGAFLCESDDKSIISKVGIMTDEVREDATNNPEKWRGQIIEVEAQFITEKGSLRHPRFVRLREDKTTTSSRNK